MNLSHKPQKIGRKRELKLDEKKEAADSQILTPRLLFQVSKRSDIKTRLRKKPHQMDVLRHALQESSGAMPARRVRLSLAKNLNLREKQVYKWFWEII